MDLNQVTLLSRDVARGAAFYRALGLVQIVEDLPNYVRFEMPSGSSTLSLHAAPLHTPAADVSLGGAIMYFECEALDAKVAALKGHGLVCEPSQPISRGFGGRPHSATRTATKFASTSRARIAKIHPGGSLRRPIETDLRRPQSLTGPRSSSRAWLVLDR